VQTSLFNKGEVFASQEPDWETPPEVFLPIDKAFGGFTWDVCATPENAKCAAFYSPEHDTLSAEWHWRGDCWMNPPYGADIEYFLNKAYQTAHFETGRVVCLLPDNTSSEWWRLFCQPWPFLFWPERIQFIHPGGVRGSRPANGNVLVAMGYKPEELPEIHVRTRSQGVIVPPWFSQVKTEGVPHG
jgi:phage N-6-adenine-methyltransferase